MIIGKASKIWNIDNCALATVETSGTHSPEYTQNTDHYLVELKAGSRSNVVPITNNNPAEFIITGELK